MSEETNDNLEFAMGEVARDLEPTRSRSVAKKKKDKKVKKDATKSPSKQSK